MRARGRLAAALALGASFALGAAPAGARVSVKADPALVPGFKLSVPDYVVRCAPNKPLKLSVSASGGDRVSVDNRPKRDGNYSVDVNRQAGGSVTFAVTASGRKSTHHVRCLPQDFPNWEVHRHGTPQSQFYVITPFNPHIHGYVAVFDARGVPVWWMHSSWYKPFDGKLLPNGDLIWTRQFGDLIGLDPRQLWEERRLDGTLVRTLGTIGNPSDFHDIELMPNGHYVLETYPPRTGVDLRPYGGPANAKVYDGEIQELTPDGKRVWSWSSKDHIALSETLWWSHIFKGQAKKPPKNRAYDLVHINSVEPDGDGFVVSARFLDAVFRIDRATKKLTWKLGGTKRPASLTVKDDPLGSAPFSGQHDARLWTDHTLTVYDNGTLVKRRPRAVRYRIDTTKRTATLLEDVDEGSVPFSGCCGGARKLPGGNWVVYWGGTNLVTEKTPSGRDVIEIRFKGDLQSYRAFPITRGSVSAQQFRQGMNEVAKAPEVPQR